MYEQETKKINWLVPEDQAELENRKNLFHKRYMKMIEKVVQKQNDANRNKDKPSNNAVYLERHGAEDSSLKMHEGFNSDIDDNVLLGGIDEELNPDGEFATDPNDPNLNESCRSFFSRLIKIFSNINFYNLIYIKHAEAAKDQE